MLADGEIDSVHRALALRPDLRAPPVSTAQGVG